MNSLIAFALIMTMSLSSVLGLKLDQDINDHIDTRDPNIGYYMAAIALCFMSLSILWCYVSIYRRYHWPQITSEGQPILPQSHSPGPAI